jgi:homopolymeric O-antigen transport system ATP-binding protein
LFLAPFSSEWRLRCLGSSNRFSRKASDFKSMDDYILEVTAVSKKFRRGEQYNSLRDLLPAVARRMYSGNGIQPIDSRDFWALQDVSFAVKRGEAFGIVGGNGAGKSTLLKLLNGIMLPTRGAITVHGRVSALIEVGAGFHHDLTGRENIYLNGAILGMTREEIRRRFDAIVAFSGLEEFIDTPVKRYSSGMYARLGFSVAAHVDPDLLLVDEVLSVGDYLFQRKCVERMNEIIANGATVLFVSHNLRAVTNLCSRSVLLERGKVALVGGTAEVIRTYYERGQERRVISPDDKKRDVMITKVTVHDENGPGVEFQSGGKLFITVEAGAHTLQHEVSVVIQIIDDNQYPIFDTCTQRLGAGPITLEAGQTLKCTFRLDLSLTEGSFHVSAYLHRYVTSITYDRWIAAATFFVTGAPEARGLVTLYPRLTECRVGKLSPERDSQAMARGSND